MTTEPENKAQNFGGKAPKGRSPAYPFISLSKAMERAQELKDKEGFYAVPVTSAYAAWGISAKSSTSPQVVAALKHHGLLDYEGTGNVRSVKLSDLARRILLDKRPDSEEKAKLIQEAALTPSIYRDILNEYPDGLPSDATLETFLVLRRGFQEKAAEVLIPNLKDTIAFANLTGPVKKPISSDGKDTPLVRAKVGDMVQVEIAGHLTLEKPARVRAVTEHEGSEWVFIDGSETGIPMEQIVVEEAEVTDGQRKPPPRLPLERGEREAIPEGSREDKASLDEGEVVLRWPETLSADSVEDLRYWLEGILARADRRAGITRKKGAHQSSDKS